MNPLDFLIPAAHAQAAGAAPAAPSMMSTLLFPIILIAIMYFLMIRPQMKRQKEHRAMLETLRALQEAVADEREWRAVARGLRRVIGELRAHEHRETQVMQGFMLRDEGTGAD